MKKFIQYRLRKLSIKILKKYKPKIIAITGSVGKTSVKDAIEVVLSKKFSARKTLENYNNEIGVPLSILGVKSPGKSILGWMNVLFIGWKMVVFNVDYPEFLVLEMGADKPGDIKYLTDFIIPDIALLTAIGPSHLENFKNIEQIAREKITLLKSLPKNGLAIVNYDDDYAKKAKETLKCEVITFGFSKKADAYASDIFVNTEKNVGLTFKLNYNGSSVPIRLNNILNKSQIYAALAAALVGLHFNMNLIQIAEALGQYVLPAGRGRLLVGVKKTLIIDETYNAAPASVIAALDVLDNFKKGRNIAVLGDMLELGEYTIKGHESVGESAAKNVDYLYVYGDKSKFIADMAIKKGMDKKKVFVYDDIVKLGEDLEDLLEKDDVVLVKGSRGMHLEKVVEEIMAEPMKARELLAH